MKQKFKPMIWEKEDYSLNDFYQLAKCLDYTHIIYMIDAMGELYSVWASDDEDIFDCLDLLPDNSYFGSVKEIQDAIEYKFFDEENDSHKKVNNEEKTIKFINAEELYMHNLISQCLGLNHTPNIFKYIEDGLITDDNEIFYPAVIINEDLIKDGTKYHTLRVATNLQDQFIIIDIAKFNYVTLIELPILNK